jgi:hypothetical protein
MSKPAEVSLAIFRAIAEHATESGFTCEITADAIALYRSDGTVAFVKRRGIDITSGAFDFAADVFAELVPRRGLFH